MFKSPGAMAIGIVLLLTVPAVAFWITELIEMHLVGMTEAPASVRAVVRTAWSFRISIFASPLVLLSQAIVLVAGWARTSFPQRVVLLALMGVTVSWPLSLVVLVLGVGGLGDM